MIRTALNVPSGATLSLCFTLCCLGPLAAARADTEPPFPPAYLANFVPAEGNIVPNGDFEGEWRSTEVGALAEGWEVFNLLEGMGFGRATGIRGSAQMIAGDFCGIWRKVPVEPGRKYRLTVWMACTGEWLAEPRFGYEPDGRGWFCQRCQRFGLPRTIVWAEPEPPHEAGWRGRTWHPFSAEVNTTGPAVTIWFNPGGDGELYVDEIGLVDIGPADPAVVSSPAAPRLRRLVNGGFEGPWHETPVGMIAEGWGIFNTTHSFWFAREPGVSGWGQAVGLEGPSGLFQVVKVTPGRSYRLSYSVTAGEDYLSTARCGWDLEGGGWLCPYCGGFGFPATIHWEELWSPKRQSWPAGEWQHFSFEITATGPALSVWFRPEGGGYEVLDNISLVPVGP